MYAIRLLRIKVNDQNWVNDFSDMFKCLEEFDDEIVFWTTDSKNFKTFYSLNKALDTKQLAIKTIENINLFAKINKMPGIDLIDIQVVKI